MILSGGWKQFEGQKVNKEVLYGLARRVLGIEDKDVAEFSARRNIRCCTVIAGTIISCSGVQPGHHTGYKDHGAFGIWQAWSGQSYHAYDKGGSGSECDDG